MFKFVKGLALLIPTIIGVILLIIVLQKLPEVDTNIELMELKMNSLIGIIGVAVSVWIGLNIYNVVEKEEIYKTNKRLEEMEKKLKALEEDIEKASKQVTARFG